LPNKMADIGLWLKCRMICGRAPDTSFSKAHRVPISQVNIVYIISLIHLARAKGLQSQPSWIKLCQTRLKTNWHANSLFVPSGLAAFDSVLKCKLFAQYIFCFLIPNENRVPHINHPRLWLATHFHSWSSFQLLAARNSN
jgi:hypothetical protein